MPTRARVRQLYTEFSGCRKTIFDLLRNWNNRSLGDSQALAIVSRRDGGERDRIVAVSDASSDRLARVTAQLALYEHPLLTFSAHAKGEGVEVVIQFKDESVPVHTYYFELHPRDLDDPQFEWQFQRQLYDALHDYFVEMFIRTPQDINERRRNGQ